MLLAVLLTAVVVGCQGKVTEHALFFILFARDKKSLMKSV